MRRTILELPARPFFFGIALGFAACAVAGRIVSERPMFEHFIRFFSSIQLQTYFYPTASELTAYVRHTVPRDKTLILVGGASYFRGTGQNPGDLWSLDLQRRLGEGYAVVNFAMDQADLTAFAAVVFAILAREYPKIYYVANGNLATGAPADGGADYRYLFWDAYYKGLLPPSVAAAPALGDLQRRALRDDQALDIHLGAGLDRIAYACDLWTYLGYTRFFTGWTEEQRATPFRARRYDHEGDDPNLATAQANIRRDSAYTLHCELFAKRASTRGLHPTSTAGVWEPNPVVWEGFGRDLRAMFPAELRPRCLVVLLRANPFFLRRLTTEDRERTEMIHRLSQQAYEREGYRVVPLRAEDFDADDFVDGGHLMASGGYKVARAVAEHIENAERAERRAAAAAGRGLHDGPVELKFTLPADRRPRREPLLAVGSENVLIDYLGGDQIRLAYLRDGSAEVHLSPMLEVPAGTTHSILVSLGSLYTESPRSDDITALKSWTLVLFDDRPFWEFPVPPASPAPGEIAYGKSRDSTTAFTGIIHSTLRLPAGPSRLHRTAIDGARLRLALDNTMAGRAFPLVTTGQSSAGDVLFLRVIDATHISLGYDHWSAPLLLSPDIHLGPASNHEIELRLPALTDAGAPSDVKVSIDGQPVWRARVPAYRPAAGQIYFGQNPIGATTSETTLPHAVFENVLNPAWRG